MADDPFSDYQTTPADVAPPAIIKPGPNGKLTLRVSSDPFDVYPTAEAPPATTKATAPTATTASSAKTQQTSAMSDPGGGVEFIHSFPIVGPYLEKAGAAVDALTGNAPGATYSDRYGSALSNAANLRQGFEQQHPTASALTQVAGGITGALPAMMAAPEVFGAGAAPWYARMVPAALSGSALNAADTAVRGGSPQDIARSGELGLALGGAGVPAGEAVGAGVSALARGLSRTPPGVANVANILHESGMAPIQAEARLAQLGPFGTLADVSPALQNEAGGLASKGGAPTQILKSAMEARTAGKDTRISDAVAQNIGVRPDLTAERQGIEQDASQAASPYYNAARANPQPMDATPVVSYIDSQLADAKGGVAKTLQMARGLVTKPSPIPGVTVPEDSAQGLLGARQALDDFINRAGDADTTAGKNALRQAGAVRSQIDGLVKADPNIAAGDAAFSTKISERDALDEGTDLFKPGTRIEDVQRSVAGKTPEQVTAMQKGALASLHDRLDGVSGDWGAARQMFAKSDANRQKLDALFPGAQDLFDKIEGEMAMRQTETNVAAGSQTAARRAVQEKYSIPSGAGAAGVVPAIIGEAAGGAPGALALSGAGAAFRSAVNSMRAASNAKLINQTASALAIPSGQSGPLMDQITKAFYRNPKISALSRGANMGTSALLRNSQPAIPDYIDRPGILAPSVLSILGQRQAQ